MTEKLQLVNVPEQQASTAADQAELLRSLVARVRQDCQQQSDEYLDQTEVPHGGE
jgi:hypothetical protein